MFFAESVNDFAPRYSASNKYGSESFTAFLGGRLQRVGAPSIQITNFLVKSPTKSQLFNHQFFCFKSPKCAVYVSWDKYLKSENATFYDYTAHFGHLTMLEAEIMVIWLVTSEKKMVTKIGAS